MTIVAAIHDTDLDSVILAPCDAGQLADAAAPYADAVVRTLAELGATAPLIPSGSGAPVGVSEEVWPAAMRRLNDELRLAERLARERPVRRFVEEHVGATVTPFPIAKTRIHLPGLGKSRYAWHQDARTWPDLEQRYPRLAGASIVTLWLAITATDAGNGLELLDRPTPPLDHAFVPSQGYFSAAVDEEDVALGARAIAVHGPPFTAALFGQNVLHRSLSGSPAARISFDLRYYRHG